MMFNKSKFIQKNNEFLYKKLEDFLRSEIYEDSFDVIYNFVELINFRNGDYEGNQYLLRKINTKELLVIDIVSEEFIKDTSQTRFNISVNEMLFLNQVTKQVSVIIT